MRRYQNFDLELFDYRREAGEERFRLRVARAPDGSQMALGEAQALGLPAGLRARLQPLEAPGLGRPAVIALGLELGDLLLPPGPARQLFERSLVALGEDEGLRLRLLIEAPELASLPWELAYLDLPNVPAAERDARGFLVLRRPLSLARHEVLAAPAAEFSPVAAPRLLCLLSAKGAGLAPLDLAAERQGVEQALEGSRISVESPERATLSALQQGLAGGAQLFHYAGHGEFAAEMGEIPRTREGKGFLLLEDEAGQPLDVAAEQLGLNLAGAGVRLALLNGCETGRRDPAHAWSGIAPLLAQAGIPAVLAHQFRIADDAAIELAGSFYRSLAGGEPVDAAVAEARLALANRPGAGARDFATPVLYLRLGEDSDGVLLPSAAAEPPSTAEPRPNRWFWLNLALLAALVAAALPWLAERYLGLDLLVGAGAGALTLLAAWGIVDRLAGEELNRLARGWLRRKAATAWLGGLLAASGVALALAPGPSEVVLLLPLGKVGRAFSNCASLPCLLRIEQQGKTLLELDHLEERAIVLARDAGEARAALEPPGHLVDELLALRPAGEFQRQREEALRELLKEPRVAEASFDPDRPLQITLFKDRSTAAAVLCADQRTPAELEGTLPRIWFLERTQP
ncbi:MAG: CHAT domain-containing protein [Thermoanaerobaculia bacterium]